MHGQFERDDVSVEVGVDLVKPLRRREGIKMPGKIHGLGFKRFHVGRLSNSNNRKQVWCSRACMRLESIKVDVYIAMEG